jgi:hypothetical protein
VSELAAVLIEMVVKSRPVLTRGSSIDGLLPSSHHGTPADLDSRKV